MVVRTALLFTAVVVVALEAVVHTLVLAARLLLLVKEI
jgi:hypothetical protein